MFVSTIHMYRLYCKSCYVQSNYVPLSPCRPRSCLLDIKTFFCSLVRSLTTNVSVSLVVTRMQIGAIWKTISLESSVCVVFSLGNKNVDLKRPS